MNQLKQLPELDKVTKTIAKSRRCRRQLELASLQLEELILQLESNNKQRRKKYLEQVLTER